MTDEPIFNPDDEEMEVIDSDPSLDLMQDTLDSFLQTASVDAVYGDPIETEDTVIIPAAEVLAVMGFGVGSGYGTNTDQKNGGEGGGSGGGGGGRVFSRPVAVIISSNEGVRVEPVVDVTKLALAALTAGGFMLAMIARMADPRKAMKALRDGDLD